MTHNFYSYQDHRIHYEDYGSGDRVVLLIHGILMDTVMNRPIARVLEKQGYRVLLVDVLGHGKSDKPDDISYLRMDSFAKQCLALLDHLNINDAVFGGASLGAGVSLQAIIRQPEKVRGLLLEMPVLENASVGVSLVLAPLLLGSGLATRPAKLLTKLMGKIPRPKNETITSLLNGLSAKPEDISAILRGTLVGPIAPSIGQRQRIRVPTIIISHAGDALHPFEDAENLAEQIPNAHFIQATSPLEFRRNPNRIMQLALPTLEKCWQPQLKVAS